MRGKRIKNRIFFVSSSFDPAKLNEELGEDYSVAIEKSEVKKISYFDTFDWRLYNKGYSLFKESDHYSLVKLDSNQVLESIPANSKLVPKFWQDFPESLLKSVVKPILSIRALILIIDLESMIESFRILSGDEKTVSYVYHKKFQIINGKDRVSIDPITILESVRGYGTEFGDVKKSVANLGFEEYSKDFIAYVLREVGKRPGDYSNKIQIKLSPDLSAEEATKKIMKNLLITMKVNEEGIEADIDTEFLHDFRVAIRRTRSALSQIKGVFPKETTDKFKKDFSVLGKMTNRLRDLDVYLLEKNIYKGMLPPDLQPEIEAVFKKLAHERTFEHKKLRRQLKSEDYKSILASWEDFLSGSGSSKDLANNSSKSVIEIARKFIWKKYKQIISSGRKIDENTADPELHSLRIECKKLRYLLEFFSSLFPPKKIDVTIKQLKKLQDNLGSFNDLYVQQESLKRFLEENIAVEDKQKTAMAIGGLVAILNHKQKEVRNQFEKTFKEFSKEENSELFKGLFFN